MIYTIIIIVVITLFSVRWNWWRLPKDGLPVLMYHKIGKCPRGSKIKKLWVSENKFSKQMYYLKKHGYNPVTFADIEKTNTIPEKAVIITFDDGYENNFKSAVPIMKKYAFKAVFFIVAQAVNRDNFWHNPENEKRISMVSIEQIKETAADGYEFGSHTLTHPNLEKIDEMRMNTEIFESKNVLESMIKKSIISFAYPYGGGAFNPKNHEILKNAGYKYACSIRQGKADIKNNPFCLKRILIRGDDDMLDFHLNITRGKSRF